MIQLGFIHVWPKRPVDKQSRGRLRPNRELTQYFRWWWWPTGGCTNLYLLPTAEPISGLDAYAQSLKSENGSLGYCILSDYNYSQETEFLENICCLSIFSTRISFVQFYFCQLLNYII